MRQFSATPKEMFASFWRNRELIFVSAKREILGRYRGSVLGLLWSFFNPLLMLSVYTFVFSEVFKARWGASSGSKAEFALVLFAGLIVFNLFAECINRSPTLIVSNPNYVKKVIFPLEVLPFINILSGIYHAAISLIVWLIAYIVLFGIPHLTVLLFPLVLFPFAVLIIGMCWCLASLGVFLRDVAQFVGIVVTVLMFLSPLFYPASALPENYRDLLFLNPVTFVIEMVRDVLYWGKMPNFISLAIYWVISLGVAWFGFFWFQKTRKGFADVL